MKELENQKGINRRFIAALARFEEKMDGLIARVMTKDDMSRIDQRFDGIAGQLDDIRFQLAVHADTLLSHDRRLNKLEARKSS